MFSKMIIEYGWESGISRDKVVYSVIQGIEKVINETADIRIIESLQDAIKTLESIVG